MTIKNFKELRDSLSESTERALDAPHIMNAETLAAVALAAKAINESAKIEMEIYQTYRSDPAMLDCYHFKF